jgi:hypothetical protein
MMKGGSHHKAFSRASSREKVPDRADEGKRALHFTAKYRAASPSPVLRKLPVATRFWEIFR